MTLGSSALADGRIEIRSQIEGSRALKLAKSVVGLEQKILGILQRGKGKAASGDGVACATDCVVGDAGDCCCTYCLEFGCCAPD